VPLAGREGSSAANRRSVLTLGLVVLLGACTFTRKGVLTRLETGAEFPVAVAITETETRIEGTDPETGEHFEGTLRVQQEKNAQRGMLGPDPAVGGGSVTPGVAPMPATGMRQTIVMVGRLEGSKGTSVKCTVQIRRTLELQGTGTCRIVDSDDVNPAYRVRF